MKQQLQLSFSLLLMVLTSQIGLSATLVVDDTNGSDNGMSPFATIAAAVLEANDGDVILVNGGNDNIHTEAEIEVDGFTNLTIQGEGINTTIIQAATTENSSSGRIFNVGTVTNQTINLTITDMTIRYGDATDRGGGGAIFLQVSSTLNLEKCKITNNRFEGGSGRGGGILSRGSLIMEDCVIQNNSLSVTTFGAAIARGGGVYSDIISGLSPGILNINRCSFYNNSVTAIESLDIGAATAQGGGLFFNPRTVTDTTVFITNSTFSSNTTNATAPMPTTTGGGMSVLVALNDTITINLINNTFNLNEAAVGGGFYNEASGLATLNLTNNIFANSTGGNDTDFAGSGTTTFATNDNNLSETCGTGCPTFASTSDPMLGGLEDCVFTRVHRLQIGSPAINTGTAVGASALDQCFGARIGNTDIGAIEFETPLDLPVELLNFTAKQRQTSIILSWQTASETNNEGFEIEKSSNGKVWKAIDFIKGAGTTLEQQNYSFVDESPLTGINYYRLKQMDFDGAYEYSEVVAVDIKQTKQLVRLQSNLVQDQLTILVADRAELKIVNVMGVSVQQNTISGNSTIEVSNLAAGTYHLLVTVGERMEVLRFVKL